MKILMKRSEVVAAMNRHLALYMMPRISEDLPDTWRSHGDLAHLEEHDRRFIEWVNKENVKARALYAKLADELMADLGVELVD